MNPFACRNLATTLFLILAAASVLPAADHQPVTLENLIARVPVLSSKNDKLTSFYFKAECNLPTSGKPLIGGEVAWRRDGGFGIVGVAGSRRAPQLFMAENWILLYAATSAAAVIDDSTWPNIRLATGKDKIGLLLGYTDEKGDSDVCIDLPSFFKLADRDGTLTQVDLHTWRYMQISASGNSDLIADFKPAKPYPLTRLEVHFEDEYGGPLVISEISVNEPVPARLTKFPKLAQLPKELSLRAGSSVDRPQKVEEVQADIVFARFALDDPELRQEGRFAHVDWEKSEQTDATILPQLRKLFLAPEQPAP